MEAEAELRELLEQNEQNGGSEGEDNSQLIEATHAFTQVLRDKGVSSATLMVSVRGLTGEQTTQERARTGQLAPQMLASVRTPQGPRRLLPPSLPPSSLP
jgi:hypothetical protein